MQATLIVEFNFRESTISPLLVILYQYIYCIEIYIYIYSIYSQKYIYIYCTIYCESVFCIDCLIGFSQIKRHRGNVVVYLRQKSRSSELRVRESICVCVYGWGGGGEGERGLRIFTPWALSVRFHVFSDFLHHSTCHECCGCLEDLSTVGLQSSVQFTVFALQSKSNSLPKSTLSRSFMKQLCPNERFNPRVSKQW